ncbi:MAG: hypothetical protein GY839_02020 [candidate division Zixibacteria bacterium]|nr:hypothetical protein [candidate division Zixibacteria bacterium]
MKTLIASVSLALLLLSCVPEKEEVDFTNLPYPADEDIIYFQTECDSGYQAFWSDIKLASSAYLNNSKYEHIRVIEKDIRIMGEGLFTGFIEVEMPEFILELKLQRPNKSKGRKSIWQVIEVKEKPWPTKKSKSDR